MPYQWLSPADPDTDVQDGDDHRVMRLWPHQSLPKSGFVWFIGGTAGLIALPLVTLLGSPVLWGLLPFLVLAVASIWWALQRSYRDRAILEELVLTPARVSLTRHGPRNAHAEWEANPHWVRVELHKTGGPVPNYLTLAGGPREVEIGSFLSEDERITLSSELREAFGAQKQARP